MKGLLLTVDGAPSGGAGFYGHHERSYVGLEPLGPRTSPGAEAEGNPTYIRDILGSMF
ncbi:hypothetical protein IscW_ISCW005283 [Ixodes scapularis]|uniref:Uncharacterized protein n=1 Tax=Ixodes scapularis TaxID=6945 RepID=B7PM94_IXOSC|nr:hypothetical protein IscW_ISCW005283 [Ixodes scapularis]|eukprot:XP_002434892.1 hypothetical protein IscW_ISCW005283 [Ixodes scapularis]